MIEMFLMLDDSYISTYIYFLSFQEINPLHMNFAASRILIGLLT